MDPELRRHQLVQQRPEQGAQGGVFAAVGGVVLVKNKNPQTISDSTEQICLTRRRMPLGSSSANAQVPFTFRSPRIAT